MHALAQAAVLAFFIFNGMTLTFILVIGIPLIILIGIIWYVTRM